MQNPISFEEIVQLYKACGANLSRQQELRTTINTGMLNNKLNNNLNTNYDFLNKSLDSFQSVKQQEEYMQLESKFDLVH